LAAFLDAPRVEILPVTEETAEYYAIVYKDLRAKGRPIPTNDLWIAAAAMEHGLALVSRDRHFGEVEGLRVGMAWGDLVP
jgi:predicted nucleic acid-binding protein